jgi:tRNA A-37 threonylcarbamoyl transferase component Bud32
LERELTKIKENNKNNYSISESNMSELEHEINNYGETTIIHGDPVFSNIIKKESNNIKFIDPRGGYLSKFTIFGDKFYDSLFCEVMNRAEF